MQKVNKMVWIDLLERTGIRTGSLFFMPRGWQDPRKVLLQLAGAGQPIYNLQRNPTK